MAIKAQGTTLHISTQDADATAYASATFVKVGEVTNIGEPDGEAADIDVTHLESEEKEYLSGVPDSGTIGIGMNAMTDDDGHEEMYAAKDQQERRWIKITRSDGAIRYFKGLVKKMNDIGAEVDNKVPASATIRISGKVIRVPAA